MPFDTDLRVITSNEAPAHTTLRFDPASGTSAHTVLLWATTALPISATRTTMRGHANELSILFVRGVVDPCPHLPIAPLRATRPEEPCHLATSPARLSRSAPLLSARDHRSHYGWTGDGKKKEAAFIVCARLAPNTGSDHGSMGRVPRVKDRARRASVFRCADNKRVPLLVRSLEHPLSSHSTAHGIGCP